jgi:hypothetical protein
MAGIKTQNELTLNLSFKKRGTFVPLLFLGERDWGMSSRSRLSEITPDATQKGE